MTLQVGEVIHPAQAEFGMDSIFGECSLCSFIIIGPIRAGDLPGVWANVCKAAKVLHWRAERDLAAMCRDAWNWQQKNVIR